MAAKAYASLVSLLNTIDLIHTHPLVSTFFDINQNRSISEMVNFFVDFVEKYSDVENKGVEDLVRRIADAAHKAEDIMEDYAAYRIRGGREIQSFLLDLDFETPLHVESLNVLLDLVVILDMESIKEEVIKFTEEKGKRPTFISDPTPSSSLSSSSAAVVTTAHPATNEATTMVGFDDYVERLLWDLTGNDVDRQIISITGMGGIGKTTLARNLYENSLIIRHFNVRAWITVSQESCARQVFLQALSCLKGGFIDSDKDNDQQLSYELHKTLFNRRYLIVLDDVWSFEIWDKIKFFFPENKNGSQIIVTTRESKLVDYIGSSALAVRFLNEENSWKLFSEKTFPQQSFPPELDDVGKKIVKKCGGLPLAISVIGGLLGKSPRTQEYWEQVAEDRNLVLNLGENKPSDILYLSYKYLSVCLKPCFLYLGLYPEDALIDVSQLIKFWIAEGFIKSNRGQSLEEVAESYVSDLVDRNLLLLHSSQTLRWRKCSTHDLIRDLCVKIEDKENVLSCASAGLGKTRPVRVSCRDVRRCLSSNRLKEGNLRFIQGDSSKSFCLHLSFIISRFWSLQTLILPSKDVVTLAKIWKMPLLRHIEITNLSLPNPTPPNDEEEISVLVNLQTLKRVQNLIFTEDICKLIPNIKQLDIKYDFSPQSMNITYDFSPESMDTYDFSPESMACPSYHLENLGCFNKLESLDYYCQEPTYYAGDSLRNIKFPSSLKELTLNGCKLEWGYMAVIASLPHLQFLFLNEKAIAATEWDFVDERFTSLKYLFMTRCGYVTKWTAESFNFPVLEELSITNLWLLDEIPSSMGEIPTLKSILVYGCSESANISAVEILQETQKFENLGLRVRIHFENRSDEAALFREKIQELGLTCQNLEILTY